MERGICRLYFRKIAPSEFLSIMLAFEKYGRDHPSERERERELERDRGREESKGEKSERERERERESAGEAERNVREREREREMRESLLLFPSSQHFF